MRTRLGGQSLPTPLSRRRALLALRARLRNVALLGVFSAGPSTGCSHLTKYQVEEVPIASFQATPPPTLGADDAGSAPAVPTESAQAVPTTSTVTTSGGSTATSATGPATGPPPVAILGGQEDALSESTDPKIQAAIKVLKSGKLRDLQTVRKVLSTSVFAGTGTPDEARALRLVCTKLGDKACAAKCTTYIR